MTTSVRIDAVFAGKAKVHWPGKPPSAIRKQALDARVDITRMGLVCDEQADLSVHGGVEKALHHYPSEHYREWGNQLSRDDLVAGSFGENLASIGLTEDVVCIGDIFDLGTARVQVSQGRQPCWKLNAHTCEDRMAWLFQKTGRTGWYYRVLSVGSVQVGDRITLISRTNPQWSVRRVTLARLTRKIELADAAALAALPELAERWRAAFSRMSQGIGHEDTRSRLQGS